MKVHLIKEKTVKLFYQEHSGSKQSFIAWLEKLKQAEWMNPKDMQTTFASANLLGRSSQRVVFDIGGGNYRMICRYAFGANQVHLFICWIGIHAEYDKINKIGKQYTINMF